MDEKNGFLTKSSSTSVIGELSKETKPVLAEKEELLSRCFNKKSYFSRLWDYED